MRVLLLYDHLYPETIGGVEHRNAQLAQALARRGHAPTLAGFWIGPEIPGSAIATVRLGSRLRGRRGMGATARFAAAAARIELDRYDVIETANIPYAHVLPLAHRCRVAGKPLVVTWHEVWGPTWRRHVGPWWRLPAALEAACARAGTAVAVSRLTAGRVGRLRRRRVDLLPNGVPLAEVRAAAGGAEDTGPPLVSAGRLLPEKRLDLLLAAIALLPDRFPRALLSILGDGPARGGLERLAAELGIADRVRFAGRLDSSTAVWRELGTARIAVSTSAREGFGLFPLEAMAAGLPVVACESPESAVGELVRDGREGLMTEPQAPALAAALHRLLIDDALHARLAAGAAARAAEYDWDRIAVRAEEVFQRARHLQH